ncbi:MAG: glutamine--fructose-6-phosphate transaminase (isomerizing) [Parcubacteria group bacterium]|nr:glutamine--fructose-6-phosphate transaminase (isomerizing) [Parcubacteria group bacterium]
MCGIIGYVGNKKAVPILIDGLKRLEYRGYDSAGIVVFNDDKIHLAKAKGRIIELERKISSGWNGNIGIGHTRWATHGEPSEKNAHPHTDCANRIFVCHNGIIENYKSLKGVLIRHGHIFKSETDTEVLAHIIEENLRYVDFKQAVAMALKQVHGTYGLAVMAADWPDRIITARNSSPLIIGIGSDENLIASDASAIIGRTKDVIYMNDGEIAVLTKYNVKIVDISAYVNPISFLSTSHNKIYRQDEKNAKVKVSRFKYLDISKRKEQLKWKLSDAQKGGYEHFMLKEIFEQPESISNSFRGRLVKEDGNVKLGGLESVKNKLKEINRIIVTGCGTAYLAGIIGKLMIEEASGIPCEVELASELRYRNPPADGQNLAMVAISQSGETADTLSVLKNFQDKTAPESKNLNRNKINDKKLKNNQIALGIVNVIGSTIARETDAGIYNHAGPEIGVASTKAFTSQLIILALLAVFLGRQRNNLSIEDGKKITLEIEKLPMLIKEIFKQKNKIKLIAEKYSSAKNFLYIGRKYNFPTALEGALKLKEISYIHAEGCGAGEMKHGPIAMIDENFPVVAIAPVDPAPQLRGGVDSVYDKMASNMEEIKARRGKIIAITTEGNKNIKHIADDWLYIPKTLEMLTPILAVIPLQLFAYYMGTLRRIDVDKPRNLAKSVTVE